MSDDHPEYTLYCLGVLPTALGILEICLSTISHTCDITANLSDHHWLLCAGIFNLLLTLFWTGTVRALTWSQEPCVLVGPLGVIVLKGVKFIWLIVGIVILFTHDIVCDSNDTIHAILMIVLLYALEVYILSVFRAKIEFGNCKIHG